MARILVIEGDEILRKFFTHILEDSDHQSIEASSGEEGLRLFHQNPTDLVIVDLALSRKAGFRVIQELRADFPDTKIVAVTGDHALLPEARELGAHCTLPKPFSIEEFEKAIENLLREKKTT